MHTNFNPNEGHLHTEDLTNRQHENTKYPAAEYSTSKLFIDTL